MNRKGVFCLITGCVVLLSGCSDNPNISNENLGRLGGGLAGAAVGAAASDGDAAPVVAGALVGSFIGGEMGRNKDKQNEEKAASVLNSTLAKATTKWTNPKSKTQYTMSVSQKYTTNGKTCRPFTVKKTANGAASSKNGIACLDSGVWTLA